MIIFGDLCNKDEDNLDRTIDSIIKSLNKQQAIRNEDPNIESINVVLDWVRNHKLTPHPDVVDIGLGLDYSCKSLVRRSLKRIEITRYDIFEITYHWLCWLVKQESFCSYNAPFKLEIYPIIHVFLSFDTISNWNANLHQLIYVLDRTRFRFEKLWNWNKSIQLNYTQK